MVTDAFENPHQETSPKAPHSRHCKSCTTKPPSLHISTQKRGIQQHVEDSSIIEFLKNVINENDATPFFTNQRREKEMRKMYTMIIIGTICLSIFSTLAQQARTMDPPPVGYWKFDEGSGDVAQDSSGYGNNGIIHTATWTTGKEGKALHFNGVDSWVEIPNSPTLTAFSQITLEAWIQEDIVTPELKGIISKCDGWAPPTNAEYFLGTNDDGRVFFETDHGVAILSAQTDRLITQSGRWYHVAATWSGDSYAIYIDGQLVLTGTCIPQTTLSNTLPVQIGRHGSWSWVYFHGIIDEVKIYNYARTCAEIDIDPDTLNLGSKGQWMTAYIELPEGYNAADINATTIVLNDTIAPEFDPKYGFVTNPSEYLVDHDSDGITERMIKFDRATVEAFILNAEITGSNVALTITGELYGGTDFKGTDYIHILYPVHGHSGTPSKR
jgi:hypothetical protein